MLTISRKKINTKDHELLDLETILEPTDLAHLLIPVREGRLSGDDAHQAARGGVRFVDFQGKCISSATSLPLAD